MCLVCFSLVAGICFFPVKGVQDERSRATDVWSLGRETDYGKPARCMCSLVPDGKKIEIKNWKNFLSPHFLLELPPLHHYLVSLEAKGVFEIGRILSKRRNTKIKAREKVSQISITIWRGKNLGNYYLSLSFVSNTFPSSPLQRLTHRSHNNVWMNNAIPQRELVGYFDIYIISNDLLLIFVVGRHMPPCHPSIEHCTFQLRRRIGNNLGRQSLPICSSVPLSVLYPSGLYNAIGVSLSSKR